MRFHLPMIVLAVAVYAFAESSSPAPTPEAPHSPAAVEAKRKFDLSVKLAREAYGKALVAADKDYVTALAAMEDTAMKGGISDKPEADRLDAARLAMVDQLKTDQQGANESNALNFSGKWKISYANGADRDYVISPDGSVQFVQNNGERSKGKINSGVVRLENGQVERWSFIGDRVVVEHFNPASTFPDQRPNTLGIGVPEN